VSHVSRLQNLQTHPSLGSNPALDRTQTRRTRKVRWVTGSVLRAPRRGAWQWRR
jgi:hypothetical protein